MDNSDRMKEIINKVYADLTGLSQEEFEKVLDKYKDDPLTKAFGELYEFAE